MNVLCAINEGKKNPKKTEDTLSVLLPGFKMAGIFFSALFFNHPSKLEKQNKNRGNVTYSTVKTKNGICSNLEVLTALWPRIIHINWYYSTTIHCSSIIQWSLLESDLSSSGTFKTRYPHTLKTQIQVSTCTEWVFEDHEENFHEAIPSSFHLNHWTKCCNEIRKHDP